MERKLLIPDFREPRIHFAIVCASRSCPKLDSTAYVTEALEQRLDESAKRFINDPSKNHFDHANKTLYLSKLFEWHRKDFESTSKPLRTYIAEYADAATYMHTAQQGSVRFLPYDWSLNARK